MDRQIDGKAAAEHLRSVIEMVPHAVAAFDADFRLTVANRQYSEILALPPELCRPGAALAEIFRHNARSGLYGAVDEGGVVNRWLEVASAGDRVEHVRRPDGRRYDVQIAGLPQGGIVLTYVDVTESLKRRDALEKSEARYRGILEGQTEMISRFDAECRLTFVNRAYCEEFGLSEAELLGRDLTETMTDPADRTAFKAALANLTPETPSFTGEYLEIGPSGTRRWRNWTDMALFDTGGRVIEYQGVGRDVTGRREAERALRANAAQFRAVVQDQSEYILRFRPDSYIINFINDAYCRKLGLPQGDVMGHNVFDFVDPALFDVFTTKLHRLTPDAPLATSEIDFIGSDGTPVYEQWTDRALFDADGKVVEYQCVGRDVTEQALSRAALEKSEQRFKGIAEAHPVPVLIVRLEDRHVLYASPTSLPLFGGRETLVDRDGAGLFRDDTEGRAFFDLVAREGKIDRFETGFWVAGGGELPVELTARAVDYDGAAAVALGIADITERRQAEDEISRQRDALAQSEKMSALGSLLASVAHELNNPLAVILAQAEIAGELAAEPAQAERARRIRAAAERCNRIVKTFLAMARQKPPSREPVDLSQLARGAAEMTQYALHTAGVTLTPDLAADLPPVHGDADQLTQGAVNLLINAQQALGDWDGEREVRLATEETGEGRVRMTVADSGPGVAREVRARIFEPFFTTKPEGAGTGIGLSVCANIVRAHAGDLSLDESHSDGAAFVVDLPVTGAEIAAAEPEAVPGSARIAPRKILVVDDEAEIGISIAEMLIPDGHDVVVTTSAKQALGHLSQEDFDCILSDIRMPGLDGGQFYRRIVAEHAGMARRVGFLTGDTLSATTRRLDAESGQPVLEKPFDKHDLTRLVGKLCGGASGPV